MVRHRGQLDFLFVAGDGSVFCRKARVNLYAKAAIQASNDRLNRVRRGVIIEANLLDLNPEEALTSLNLM